MLARLVMLVLAVFAFTEIPAHACPPQNNRTQLAQTFYSRRARNHCEGRRLREQISGSVELVSFTSAQERVLGNELAIRVPNPLSQMLDVSIQDTEQGYFLDEMTFAVEVPYQTFLLPTDLLRSLEIPVAHLRAIALTKDSPSIYFPVIFDQPTKHYQFIFNSDDELLFRRAEIRQGNGQPILAWAEQAPKEGEKSFEWKNANLYPSGQYTFYYLAEVLRRTGQPKVIERSIIFEHDPLWLERQGN